MARVELEIFTLINSGKIDAAVKKAEGEMARLTQLARAGTVAGGRPGAAGGLGGFAGIAAMQGLTDVAAQLRAGMLRNLSAFKGQAPKLADLNKTLDQVKQEYLKLTSGGTVRNQERVAAFNRQVAARKEEIAPTPPRAPAPVKPPLSPAQIAFDERKAAREALEKQEKKEATDRYKADQQARRNAARADGGRSAENRAAAEAVHERARLKEDADRQLETRRKGQAVGAQKVADQAAGREPLPPSRVPARIRPRLTPQETELLQLGEGKAIAHGLRATIGRAGVPFEPLVDKRGRPTDVTREAGRDVLRQVDEDLAKWRSGALKGRSRGSFDQAPTAIHDLELAQSGLQKLLGVTATASKAVQADVKKTTDEAKAATSKAETHADALGKQTWMSQAVVPLPAAAAANMAERDRRAKEAKAAEPPWEKPTDAQRRAEAKAAAAAAKAPKGPPFTDAEARAFRRGQGDTSSPAYKAWLAQESAAVSKAKSAAAQPPPLKPVELTPEQVQRQAAGLSKAMQERAARDAEKARKQEEERSPIAPTKKPARPRRAEGDKPTGEPPGDDRTPYQRRRDALAKKAADEAQVRSQGGLDAETGVVRAAVKRRLNAEERAALRASRSLVDDDALTKVERDSRRRAVNTRAAQLGEVPYSPLGGRAPRPTDLDRPSRVQTAKIDQALAAWGKSEVEVAADSVLSRRRANRKRDASVEKALRADETDAAATGVVSAAKRRRKLAEERATLRASRGLIDDEALTAVERAQRRAAVRTRAAALGPTPYSAYPRGAVPPGPIPPKPPSAKSLAGSIGAAFPPPKPPPGGPGGPTPPKPPTTYGPTPEGRAGPPLPLSHTAAQREIQEVGKAVHAAQKRTRIAEATLRNQGGLLDLSAKELIASRQATQAQHAVQRAAIKQAIATGELPRGTLTQRFQAALSGRQGGGQPRLPTDFGKLSQVLGGGLLTTARFAISGAALYGVFSGITKSIKAAEDLERIFNQINRQFESLGKKSEFSGFRTEILAIARDTGSAGAEVASVGFQLQGAFGGNTVKALDETRSAFEAVKVTGLSITEVIDAFTALTQNFREANVTIAQVSDKALGLQERFGVLAKQTISFSSDLAPVASQAGFTVEQLESLGAVAQKYSGRSGSSLAEAFGRIIPVMSQNAEQFVGLFQQLGGSDLAGKVADAFRTGNTAEFFTILLQNYGKLGKAQKDYVIQLLGGRREAQSLIPVLEHSAELLGEFARKQGDAGKTSQYYADLQSTLKQQIQELSEAFTQVGVALFEGGLGEFLKDLVGIVRSLVEVFGALAGVLSTVAGVLGSIPGAGEGFGLLLESAAIFMGAKGVVGAGRGVASARTAAGAGGAGFLGSAGGAATGFLAGSGIKGLGSRYLAGAATGYASVAGSTMAAQAGATVGTRILASGSGFIGGLKGALGTGGFIAIGALVGKFVIDALVAGIKKDAAQYVKARFGETDEFAGDPARQQGALQAIGITGVSSFEDLRRQAAAQGLTTGKLGDALQGSATKSQGTGSQLLATARNIPGLGNLSGEDADKRATVEKIIELLDKSNKESIGAMLNDQVSLQEAVKIKLRESFGINAENLSPEELAPYVDQYRLQLEVLLSGIEAGTASYADLEAFLKLQKEARTRAAGVLQQNSKQLEEILTAEGAIAKFEAGDIGYAPAKRALDNAIQIAKSMGYDKASPGDPNRDKFDKYMKLRTTFMSTALLNQAKGLAEQTDLFGGGQAGAQTQIDAYLSALQSKLLNRADAEAATKGVIGGLKALQDARLAAADSAEEQARLLASGVPAPEAARAELIYQNLSNYNIEFQVWIDSLTAGNGAISDAITKSAADIFAKGDVTIQEAVKQSIKLNRDILLQRKKSLENTLKSIGILSPEGRARVQSDLDRTNATLGALPVDIPKGVDIDAFLQKRKKELEGLIAFAPTKAMKQRYQTELDAVNKQIETTPADLKVPDYKNLFQDPEATAKKNRDIAIANQKARFDLEKAMIEGDPVAEAQIAQRQADYDAEIASAAGDTAGQLAAQAARIRADRTLQQAMQDIGNAQIELAIAMAESADDVLKASDLQVDLARKKLADLITNTPGDTAGIDRAQADVIRAETAARKSKISEGQSAIQTSLDLERISKGQAIAQLEALKQFATTQKEIDQIDLEIKQLRDQLGQDFQFNIPSAIGLPTLYEARRLNQTPGGQSYQNSVIINFTANNTADATAIANIIVDGFGGASRFGTDRGMY